MILSKINKFVCEFKELFWNENIKDMLLFFTFILVMISMVLPLTNKIVAPILAIFILLVALSYMLDNVYKLGIKIEKDEYDKLSNKEKER